MNPEARTWRRLALAASGAIVLLVARVRRGEPLARNWLGETPAEQLERRLAACESNLDNIWEHLNARDTSDR